MLNFIYGMIIGIGFIVPGVSGGVIATILGIYDDIIDKIIHFSNDIKNNIYFLFPLFGGIILSILIFSNLILYFINNHLIFISYIFIGLILGCIPYLIKEIKFKTNKSISIFPFFITLIIGFILYYIEINNSYQNINNINFFTMFLAGFFYAAGKVIPGISGSALLMLIGVYKYFLEIIANPFNLTIHKFFSLIPFILSFFVSCYFLLKVMYYLLNNHFRLTYSIIIGFVISSTLFLYPYYFNIESLIILICSFLISYNLCPNK